MSLDQQGFDLLEKIEAAEKVKRDVELVVLPNSLGTIDQPPKFEATLCR